MNLRDNSSYNSIMLDEPFNHEHEVNVSQCNFLTEIIYNFSKIILQTMPIAFLLSDYLEI